MHPAGTGASLAEMCHVAHSSTAAARYSEIHSQVAAGDG